MCIEIGHSKADCKVVDLYNIDDPVQIQQIMNSIGGQQISNLSGIDHAGSYLNHNHQIEDLNDDVMLSSSRIFYQNNKRQI